MCLGNMVKTVAKSGSTNLQFVEWLPMSETINSVIVTPIWEQIMKERTAGKNMSLEKSFSQHFSILQCVDARNDYTGLVIATVVIRVYDAHGALLDGLVGISKPKRDRQSTPRITVTAKREQKSYAAYHLEWSYNHPEKIERLPELSLAGHILFRRHRGDTTCFHNCCPVSNYTNRVS